MNRIELLANDIALMSNDSLNRLAQELIDNYPTRATALTDFLWALEQDQMERTFEEFVRA
jgi:hypothetical protein